MRLVALLAVLLVGCVDNSGGDAPPGVDVAVEVPDWDTAPQACMGDEGAFLLTDEASVDAWFAECMEDVGQTARVLDAIGGLGSDQKLVAVRLILGGCVQAWNFMGMHQDAETLHVWVLKEDTAYGRTQVACTDDLGWANGYWVAAEGDVGSVTEANLWLGRFNPQLPGGPPLPG